MKLIGLLLAFALAIESSLAFGQVADPYTFVIESARAYDGVIDAGDMLVIVEYTIDYDTLPTATVTDNFLVRFMRGNSELNASEILTFNNSGYGLGVASMYFSAADMTAESVEFGNPNGEDYAVWLQGKPSAFPDPPTDQLAGIIYRDANDTRRILETDIAGLATNLENDPDWAVNSLDMIDFVAGQQVLTAAGESYFGQAVPNLQVMIPALFRSSLTSPGVFERDFNFSERDAVGSFWDGTAIGNGFDSVGTLLAIDAVVIAGIVGFILMGFFVFLANRVSGNPEFGIVSLAFTFPLAIAMGLGSMTALMLVGAIAVLGIGFALFLRRAT